MSDVTDPQSPLRRFIASARSLFAVETDLPRRWEKLTPLLEELLSAPALKERSKAWPIGAPKQNLLFYEDADYKFIINGVIKPPRFRTAVHDHAHNWTLYGVLDGHETIERYVRTDDRSKSDHADIRKTVERKMGPGDVDLVPPYEIHLEESGDERTVAIAVRAERVGRVLHGRYDPATGKYWEGHAPEQVSFELLE